jgi:hypothetical protein
MWIVVGSDDRIGVTKHVVADLRDEDHEHSLSRRLISQALGDEILGPRFGLRSR